MQRLVKNGATSNILRVRLRNSSTGQGLTGLTIASSGLIISTIANNESAATAYTAAGSTIETIATLGTFAAPTAGKCRFKEVDATNHPGSYEIQLADARYAVSGAKSLLTTISGATNLLSSDVLIQLTAVDVDSAADGGITRIDAAISSRGTSTLAAQDVADALKLAPTAGTAATGSVNSSLALIKAKTDLITAGVIEVTSPVDVDGPTVTLIQGDDYYAADGRAVTFTSTEWPNLASATVVLRVGGLYNFSMTVTSNAGTISRDFTRTETAAFVPNTYDYQVIATLANGDVVTLIQGLQSDDAGFTINPRIPTA